MQLFSTNSKSALNSAFFDFHNAFLRKKIFVVLSAIVANFVAKRTQKGQQVETVPSSLLISSGGINVVTPTANI